MSKWREPVYYRDTNCHWECLLLLLPFYHVPASEALLKYWPFSWSTAGTLKCTIVGGLPSENIWEALIAPDRLELSFEVGRPGRLPEPVSQADLSRIAQLNTRRKPPSFLLLFYQSTESVTFFLGTCFLIPVHILLPLSVLKISELSFTAAVTALIYIVRSAAGHGHCEDFLNDS